MGLELRDTIDMMVSGDYRDRFEAEYYQLLVRYNKLKDMVEKWDKDALDFEPKCPRSLYNLQLRAMSDYIAVLEARAAIEDVDLE